MGLTAQPSTSTEYERLSLARGMNLSDGHTRQPLTRSQKRIVARLPELFAESERRTQEELELEFIEQFFGLAGQSTLSPSPDRYLLSYSASTAINLISLLLQARSLSVALIHPAFDNIPNSLRRHRVPLTPLSEESLIGHRLSSTLSAVDSDVIWIVCPNNPTGFELCQEDFAALVNFCAAYNRILVIDFCFRFFSSHLSDWDQYELLEASGISYITIEDTGKTWPTLDMKIGGTVCSSDLFPELYQLHDDLLLNVSPFHLALLIEFIRDTRETGLEKTILRHVRSNRRQLRRALEGSTLIPTVRSEATTMEWLRIEGEYSDKILWRELREVGIHILPGSNFFWDQPELGTRFVRIPLTRAPELIAAAAPGIRRVSDECARRSRESLQATTNGREHQ